MPQVLKDEIRERIRLSALNEFFTKNFRAARITSIAEGAGVPLGLIYSYYKNKNDLFEHIVSPVKHRLNSFTLNEMSDIPEDNLYRHELPALLECIEDYHKEIIILVDKSEGSHFEGAKDELIEIVAEHLKKTPVLRDTDFEDIFFHILATNFMEGVFEIARHYRGKDWAENMMTLLIRQHLYGSSSFQKKHSG
ncbi:MAG: TetR/AcrR family transcriptional regulator [Spirochaetales bacterium]|nr:TetR/AcrR family transcriptional regulator [Spirochaetales bacterium]